ncbi:helicase-exonuclease AddAB subunit AddA [Planctomycetota bacterium]
MAKKKIEWTKQQSEAIKNRGSDVLVTASAGTGKTAVLSGRCVDIVSEKTDVRNMLVLTFTDAAAEQMRQRIAEQLTDVYSKTKQPHLRRQILLLSGADISTIHSFCKRLITEFFFQLSLDPTFRVIDEDQQQLIKADVLEQTIDWAWQEEHLTNALEQLLYHRDLRTNDGFAAQIIRIHNFLNNVFDSDDWFQRAVKLAEARDPFATDLAQKQKEIIYRKLQSILSQLQHALNIYQSQNSDGDWAEKCEAEFICPVTECLDFLRNGKWDKCAEKIINCGAFRVTKPKNVEEPIDLIIKNSVRETLNSFTELRDLAVLNPDYLRSISGSVTLQTRVIIELVRKFGELYTQAKRTINALDFADLQHYALELLTERNASQNKITPSQTALALRRKYKYIFVDEYQDINPVQKAILDTLSCEDNLFVVGDIKQSIYAFRGAEPGIFLGHLKSASKDPKNAAGGFKIDLNENFRSDKGILDFVNRLFSRVMTVSLTKIDYDDSARLRPASQKSLPARQPQTTKPIVELHILDEQEKGEDSQDNDADQSSETRDINSAETQITSRQRQAALIARRIKQIVGAETGKPEFKIYDKLSQQYRYVQYRDIVVLMRSPSERVNDYAQVLQLAGINVSSEFGTTYFEATEISDMLSLLKVLDNPQRDIEFAALLRSPFFNFTDTELASITINGKQNANDKKEFFYDCIRLYSQNGPQAELAEKVRKALEQIEEWRTAARRGSVADLIWQIYRQTGLLSFVLALPSGHLRKANLLKLHDRAIQFEDFASAAGIGTLTRFVEFLEKLGEAKREWAPAKPESAAENAVCILSVHKSKGLEFPVVFLAELNSKFNVKDNRSDCIVDADNTLGLQIIEPNSNTRLSSLAHQVISEKKKTEQLSEEMRILYVATTRARHRLILTGCEKQNRCCNILSDGFCFGDGPIAGWKLKKCSSSLEWILYGLSQQANLHKAFNTPFAQQINEDGLFSFHFYDQSQLQRLSACLEQLRKSKAKKQTKDKPKSQPTPEKSKLFLTIKDALAWRYRFGDAPSIAAKHSVTELTHTDDEFALWDYSDTLAREPAAVAATGKKVDSRLIGTATHLVISQLDLTQPIDKKTVKKLIEKLISDGAITDFVAEFIDTDAIVVFFQSELGKIVLGSKDKIRREWPFTFALPVEELPDYTSQMRDTSSEIRDTIIVQGIIDMLVLTPDGLLVIDFKTDDITADKLPERANLYRNQLLLYLEAAQRIIKTKVTGKWLYFLKPKQSLEIK